MWNERSVQRILELQARMSIAIFGVGSVDADYPSHVYAGGYLDEDDLNVLASSDVVGDVATVFFRADGSSDGITLNERSTGPDLAQLRQVRRRICVVSGASKINGLRGRPRGGPGHRPDPGRGQRPPARPLRRTGLSGCGAA